MTATLHTVRFVPVGGSPPTADRAATRFEAQVSSHAGVRHGSLTARRPSGAHPGRPCPGFVDEHLALDLTEPEGFRWRRHADVLHVGLLPAADLIARLAEVLSAHPGCAVTTAEHRAGTVLILARTGSRLIVRPARGTQNPSTPAPSLTLGSLAHAWLAAGRTLADVTGINAAGRHSPESAQPWLSLPRRRVGG
ncbi:hypothetical protein P3T27_000592 [Kitasatospora sp. MAA19]|uniref:hypothetical protein n=1 Tax=unclassified Kitasatospora TaxID=2633591 RepID=UPI002473041B|nr:hypothetical protein [Kitasatospora sp. MAA19]MDH6703891.1 hypothetical protein [Kitasatospora sp. MAA19]